MPEPALGLLALGDPLAPPGDPISLIAAGITAGLVVLCFWLILTSVNLWVGLRQKREGNGTWGRLLVVAGVIAAMQAAPAGVAMLIWALNGHGIDERELFASAIGASIFSFLFLLFAMGPTVRFQHSREALPLVKEESLLRRVAELARLMRLKTPVVRLLSTGGGELSAIAFAGGLVSPSLVVGDGILHRLSPEERDATLAHELAHLANHSLWWLTAVVPMGSIAAVLMSLSLPLGVAVGFGLTLFIGLRHLVSRHFEYDCDCRAARAVGFRTTASALAKIHAANPIRDLGWLSFVVFATATHPSRTERLAAVRGAAPTEDRPPVTWSEGELHRRRIAGRIAAGLWFMSLIAIPMWAFKRPDSNWPTIWLGTIFAIPLLAIIVAARQGTREARRRMVERGRYKRMVLLVVGAAFVGWLFTTDPFAVPMHDLTDTGDRLLRIVTLFGILGATLILIISCLRSLLGGVRETTHQQQVTIAMQTRNFDRVFALAEKHPQAFRKSARLRHNLGFAAAITGRREQAIEVLESLRRDEPGFTESVLVLAMTHFDEGRSEQALSLIEEVQAKLPNDPTPLMLRGDVLRRLGRIDEAQACIDRTLEIKPDSGNAYAAAAWIALDRGDREQAAALLETAEEHDPATAYIEYVKAQVALAGDDPEAAREQVQRAVAASDANPYALLQKQVRELADRAAV